MIKVVLRTTDLELMIGKLADLGFETRSALDEEGNSRKIEERIERCNTPALIDARGHVIVTVLMTEAQAELLPEYLDPPEFVCDWMTGVLIEETEDVLDPETGEVIDTVTVQKPLDWPQYDIEWVDAEGKTQTGRQDAGRIS